MIPEPTPEQAVRVLNILSAWNRRGWYYLVLPSERVPEWRVAYSDPETSSSNDPSDLPLDSVGVSPFDALCQATTVMQVLLSEHPE